MTSIKNGQRGWEVEWCKSIPIDPETGDSDMDNAEYVRKVFKTEAAALAYANEMLPLDAWGSVVITPVEYAADVRNWECCGESQHIER